MNIHNLDLVVLNKSNALYLWDTSSYNPDIEPTHLTYSIVVPGFSTAVNIPYVKNTMLTISPGSLNQITIVDGAWCITQSVAPNDKVYKTYIHFKITDLLTTLTNKANDILSCTTVYSSYSTDEIVLDIGRLEMAKSLAELCGAVEKASIIYNQIKEKYVSELCGTC